MEAAWGGLWLLKPKGSIDARQYDSFPVRTPWVRNFDFLLLLKNVQISPAGLARSKKRARRRLKGWMRACAPNVLHAVRLGICRHKAEWAYAGTLPGSPATITGPWRTRRIFANHLRGTNFTGQTSSPSICHFGRFPKNSLFARFSGRRSKSNFLGNSHMQQLFSHNVHCD